MAYKLVSTQEMDRLIDNSINYLLYQLNNEQAANHLIKSLEELYNNLELSPFIYRQSMDTTLMKNHYYEAKLSQMDYIVVFRIEGDTVFLLGLFHCLENYSEKMFQIWGDV